MAKSKKIDWLNHGLEFVVVIVGILLAFQLDSCREDRKNEVLLRQHLSNIIEETEFNLRMVDSALIKGQEAEKNLNQLLQLIAREQQFETINALSMQQLAFVNVYIKRNAYQSLIQSGDVRLIDDFELKNDIINLYEYYNWTEFYDEVNGEVFTAYFLPYVMKEFDLFQLRTQEPEVYTDQRFKNALGTMSYQFTARLEKYRETQERIRAFLEKYEEL
ncbi:DUF6090 family protein [Gilvibacter sediminis]|uniref:DUF6090 family protein n=1 Tax=Gilvibacter sediminis TaxID=379071 RepID=UPI002350DC3D|nr:DUF6090 family protein [Gilvibacter sediminis]MDC7996562.1 DUF6090 family protein [Gilvibacter sediminis]